MDRVGETVNGGNGTQGPGWLAPLGYLTQNRLSLAGVLIATSAVIFWLFLLPAGGSNPYLGLLTFGLLPALLLLGLLLIPFGLWRQRRSGAMARPSDPRRLLLFLGVTTLVNVLIGSQTGYRAVHYMDSVQFCGQTCHSVMQPEFKAYQVSTHSGVDCVKCHIAGGPQGFLRAKMNGLHQVWALASGSFHRPIPVPVANLPGADETCETCHARRSLDGEKLRVVTHYDDNESNTPKQTVLMMKIGAIHRAHLGSKRLELKSVSCLDCHNRPAHTFELPEDAVDRAVTKGVLPRAMKFVRKNAVAALREGKTAAAVNSLFLAKHPGSEREAAAVTAIFERNVFPEMNITWGTYPSQLGHNDSTGCFRCHDGKKQTQDCNTCHTLVAMDEGHPKVLEDLGLIEPLPVAAAKK